jgi:hypothetical protein
MEALRLNLEKAQLDPAPHGIVGRLHTVTADLWLKEESCTSEILAPPANKSESWFQEEYAHLSQLLLSRRDIHEDPGALEKSYLQSELDSINDCYNSSYGDPDRDCKRYEAEQAAQAKFQRDYDRVVGENAAFYQDIYERFKACKRRDKLRAARQQTADVSHKFVSNLAQAYAFYIWYIHSHVPTSADRAGQNLSFLDFAQNDVGKLLSQIMGWLSHEAEPLGLFNELSKQVNANCERIDRQQHVNRDVWLSPNSRLSPTQMVDGFFGGTPMRQLFDVEIAGPEAAVPEIEEHHWYQHSLLIAPTQTGKTNVIQWRIANLLPQIAAGKASLVLMEPRGC